MIINVDQESTHATLQNIQDINSSDFSNAPGEKIDTVLFIIQLFFDKIIPTQNGTCNQKNVNQLKLLAFEDQLYTTLHKLQVRNLVENISSDDITDGPRPDFLKLQCLKNIVTIMLHKFTFENKIENIRNNDDIKYQDEISVPLELCDIRNYRKQIEIINNSKVTQTYMET